MFTIPTCFTQGDNVAWTQRLQGYSSLTDTLSCFIRGATSLDLTASGNPNFSDEWDFAIAPADSNNFTPGLYKAQFVLFNGNGRTTLGEAELNVKPSFENLTSLDTVDEDLKELNALTVAIGKIVSGGIAEYYIGTRRARYQDLSVLIERQTYLRNRVARKKNKSYVGGLMRGISFCDW